MKRPATTEYPLPPGTTGEEALVGAEDQTSGAIEPLQTGPKILSEKQETEEATPRHPKLDRLASVRAEMARLMQPPPDAAPTRDDLVLAAIEARCVG